MNTTPPPLAESNAPVRAVLADDERLMREQLRARLAEVWPALIVVAIELMWAGRPQRKTAHA